MVIQSVSPTIVDIGATTQNCDLIRCMGKIRFYEFSLPIINTLIRLVDAFYNV